MNNKKSLSVLIGFILFNYHLNEINSIIISILTFSLSIIYMLIRFKKNDYLHAVQLRLISTDFFLRKKLRKRLSTDDTDLHRLFRLIILHVQE